MALDREAGETIPRGTAVRITLVILVLHVAVSAAVVKMRRSSAVLLRVHAAARRGAGQVNERT